MTISDFAAFAQQLKFDIANPQFDGQIHRFGRNGKKDNAWFIGHQGFDQKSGDPFYTAVLGDWVTGEKHTWNSFGGKKVPRANQKLIADQIEQAKKKAEGERLQKQAEAALEARKLWAQAVDAHDHPYLADKKIRPHGTKTFKKELLVPMQNTRGEVVGIQRIQPDGSKWFMKYQQTSDTYFTIPGQGKIVVCEGFATGASIAEATGFTVIVAFNSGNLPKIARHIRREHPDAPMIVAADNDYKTEGNPGLAAGAKAAKYGLCEFIYPADIAGTDFNDLHNEHGLDAVAQYFLDAQAEPPFFPLGESVTGHDYWLKDGRLYAIKNYSPTELFRLQPYEKYAAWKPTPRGKPDWDPIKSELIAMSKRAGIYDPSRVRGTGVWEENGEIVINTGNSIVGDPKTFKYIFSQNRIAPPQKKSWDPDLLFEICEDISWSEKYYAKLFIGWLGMARLIGILPTRPHLWITAGAGTGKSTIFEKIAKPMLGDGYIAVAGTTTEPGLRQTIGRDAIPVIFDEFETNDKKSNERVQDVMDLFRLSFTSSNSVIAKGTVSGQAQNYRADFCAMVGSIRVNIQNEADKGRFCVLELRKAPTSKLHWINFSELTKRLTPSYAAALFSYMTGRAKDLINFYSEFYEAMRATKSPRDAQRLSPILAAYSIMNGDLEPNLELVDQVFPEPEDETDEHDLVDTILHTSIRVQFDSLGDRVVHRLETIASCRGTEYASGTEIYGVRWLDDETLFVANDNHPELRKILKNTKWATGWSRTLRRQSDSTPAVQRLSGRPVKGTTVLIG